MDKMVCGNSVEKMFLVERYVKLRFLTGGLRTPRIVELLRLSVNAPNGLPGLRLTYTVSVKKIL